MNGRLEAYPTCYRQTEPHADIGKPCNCALLVDTRIALCSENARLHSGRIVRIGFLMRTSTSMTATSRTAAAGELRRLIRGNPQ